MTTLAVFALVAQPVYGLVSSEVAHATPQSVEMTYFQTMNTGTDAAALHFGVNFTGVTNAESLDVHIEREDGSEIVKSLKPEKVDDYVNGGTGISGYVFTKEVPGTAKYDNYIASNSSWERAKYADGTPGYVQWTQDTEPTKAWAVITTESSPLPLKSDKYDFHVTGLPYTYPTPAVTGVYGKYSVKDDYTGIYVGFHADQINAAIDVELRIHDNDGDPSTYYSVKAKPTGSVLNTVNNSNVIPGVGETTGGTVLIQGERESGSWTNQIGSWTGSSRPTHAEVVITMQDGSEVKGQSGAIIEDSSNGLTEEEAFADRTAPTATLEVKGGNVVDGTRYVRPGDTLKYTVEANDTQSGLDRASYNVFKLKANGVSQISPAVCGSWHNGKFPLGSNIATGSFTMKNCNGGTAPADGLYGLGFRVYDNAGNNHRIPNAVFTVDGTDPVVSDFNAPSLVAKTLNVTAKATDSGSGVEYVKFSVAVAQNGVCKNNYSALSGYTNKVSYQANGEYSASIDTSALASGEYCVLASARDNVTNNSTPLFNKITVDNTAPIASITVDPVKNGMYVTKNVTITGSVDPSEFLMKSHWFEITGPNGYSIAVATGLNKGGSSYSIDWNTSSLASGAYTIRYVATDAAGNRNDDPNYTNPTKLTVIVDNQGPQASFTSTIPTYFNGNFAVTGIASDNIGLKSVFFDIRDAGNLVGGCVPGSSSIVYSDENKNATLACEMNTFKLEDGKSYTLRIHASDNAGYGGGESRQITFDTTNPVVNISSTPKGNIGGEPSYNVSQNVAINIDEAHLGVTNVHKDNDTLVQSYDETKGTTFSLNSGLNEGRYYIVHIDKAGNESFKEYFVVSRTAASITNVEGLTAGSFTLLGVNKDNIVKFTVGKNGGSDIDEVLVRVKTYDATKNNNWGSVQLLQTALGDAEGNYQIDLTDLLTDKMTDGEKYVILLQVRNAAGVHEQQYYDLLVDNTSPLVSFDGYDSTGNVFTPKLTVSDPNGIQGYKWTTLVPDADVTISDTAVSHPTFTVHKDGTYEFTLTVTDGAGNETVKTLAFTYAAPVVDDGDDDSDSNTDDSDGFTNVVFNSANNDSDDSQAEENETPAEEVAGASDDKSDDILGASTDKDNTWNIFGVAWYWLLAGLIGIFTLIALIRKLVWARFFGASS